MTINAVGTPILLSTANNNNAIFPKIITNYAADCVVRDVRITMRVTTATGFVGANTSPGAGLGVCGVGVGFSGCSGSGLYGFNFTATGNQIGTTCSDLVFDTAAPPPPWNQNAPPPPPYSGTYQWEPFGAGVADDWRLKDLQYDLGASSHPPDTILQCAQIVITTQIVP